MLTEKEKRDTYIFLHFCLCKINIPNLELLLPQPMPHREQLAVLLIGSPEGVRENIHELHQRGYAEASTWSGLLPAPNPGEVMSVLIRYRLAS